LFAIRKQGLVSEDEEWDASESHTVEIDLINYKESTGQIEMLWDLDSAFATEEQSYNADLTFYDQVDYSYIIFGPSALMEGTRYVLSVTFRSKEHPELRNTKTLHFRTLSGESEPEPTPEP